LTQQEEDKPIYNIRIFTGQASEIKKKSKNILSWKKSDLCSYLRGVFDSRGLIYVNGSDSNILSIKLDDMVKLELYQKALQKFNIYSFLYYPQSENESGELFIVGQRNILQFKEQIGFDYPEEMSVLNNFQKTLEWDD
jgi:hypothetical protein